MWRFPELLSDVHRDSALVGQMREKQERQLKQRIAVIDKAKSLGWIDPDVDSRSLSLIFWGTYIGLHLNFGSDLYVLEPEKVKSMFTKIMRSQRDRTD